MISKTTYKATATRDGRWWYIDVPELGTSGQARTVAKIEEATRDIIGVWLDVDPESFDVEVTIEIPAAAREAWGEAKRAEAAAREQEAAAAVLARQAVRSLREDGLSFKEAGAVLGLSPQRVHQLASANGGSRRLPLAAVLPGVVTDNVSCESPQSGVLLPHGEGRNRARVVESDGENRPVGPSN